MTSSLRILCALLAFCVTGTPALAQSPGPLAPSGVSAHVHTGYTSFSMNEATDFFRDVARAYQQRGINLPVQTTYPGNSLLGLDVSYTRSPTWRLDLSVMRASTEAFALYGDYAGTLDVTSETTLWTIQTGSTYTFRRDRRLQPFVGFKSGVAIGTYSVTEALRLDVDGVTEEASAKLDASGYGPSVEGLGGLRYVFGRASLRTQFGYRYARLGSDDDDFPFNLGYAGVVGTVGLEVNVWR